MTKKANRKTKEDAVKTISVRKVKRGDVLVVKTPSGNGANSGTKELDVKGVREHGPGDGGLKGLSDADDSVHISTIQKGELHFRANRRVQVLRRAD